MAGTNGRVLIYGESGTGKELVAHACTPSARARPSRSWK
jgi:transcriptional regulator with PAS, ATPase and Fis domain